MPCARTRSSVHKLEHKSLCLNITKHFFDVQMIEHWNMLPRDAMESLYMDIFKRPLDTATGSRCLWFSRGVGPDDLHNLFQIQIFFDSVNLWFFFFFQGQNLGLHVCESLDQTPVNYSCCFSMKVLQITPWGNNVSNISACNSYFSAESLGSGKY